MDKLKQYGAIIIPYITICAGIYQLTYWRAFGLNGLEVVSISELVKSAISPLMESASFILLTSIGIILGKELRGEKDTDYKDDKDKDDNKTLKGMLMLLFMVFVFGFIFYKLGNQSIPIISSFVFAAIFEKYFTIVKKRYRLILVIIAFYIPISTYIYASEKSSEIIENQNYQYLIINGVTYKYLGMNETYLICTDKNNFRIEYKRLDQIGDFTLHHFCRPKKKHSLYN